MDNNCHIPDLVQAFSWIKPGFISSQTSHLYDSRIKFLNIDNDV